MAMIFSDIGSGMASQFKFAQGGQPVKKLGLD
jgi:hypothetical protein